MNEENTYYMPYIKALVEYVGRRSIYDLTKSEIKTASILWLDCNSTVTAINKIHDHCCWCFTREEIDISDMFKFFTIMTKNQISLKSLVFGTAKVEGDEKEFFENKKGYILDAVENSTFESINSDILNSVIELSKKENIADGRVA